jgi:hypothetical protein
MAERRMACSLGFGLIPTPARSLPAAPLKRERADSVARRLRPLWVNVCFRSLGEARRISDGDRARPAQGEIVPALNSLDVAH